MKGVKGTKAPKVPKDYATALVDAEATLACYEHCLADMTKRRQQYAYAIGALLSVVDDARTRVGNLRAKKEAQAVLAAKEE